ncbi:hypothetical protein OC835_002947 [Tilletia horrida]|nr:hypothetical protein OC835_002947 [Tilletia horrida]
MQHTLEPLAIVGMSTRLPGADSAEDFWSLLMNGTDTCRQVPHDVFDIDAYYDETGAARNKMGARTGNWFHGTARKFDAPFFGLSKQDVLNMDPQQRLSLMVCYEALEDAGWTPPTTTTAAAAADSTGVFVAPTCDDYTQHLLPDLQPSFFTGNSRQFLAHRISHFFGFQGVSETIDTACNASFVALDVACTKIRNGTCSQALVGGVSVLSQPQVSIGLDKAHFLSRTGQCKTLDAGADGYSRSDAVSFVMVKKLSDAIKNKDRIYAEILAVGTNHSGESFSITFAALMKALLQESGVPASTVNLIEGHGTGTQAGDWNELSAIHETLVEGTGRDIENKVVFTSSKANIGHSEGASGLGALIKVMLIFKYGIVPPHIGIRGQLNPRLEPLFASGHIAVAREGPMVLPRGQGRLATAVASNFGASGSNSCCVVRSFPASPPVLRNTKAIEHLPVILSARSKTALQRNIDRLISAIDASPALDLASVCYTLNARRIQHVHKVAYVASSIPDLRAQLAQKKSTPSSAQQQHVSTMPNAVSISTLYEVAADLAQRVPAFRRHVARYDTVALLFGLPSFGQSLGATQQQLHRPEAEYAFSYAVSAMVDEWLIKPVSKATGVDSRYGCALLEGVEALAGSKLGGSDAARRGAAAGAGVGAGASLNELELIDPLSLLGDASWTYPLAKALTDATASGAQFDWRAIMDDLTPEAQLLALPSYAWDLEEIYVPYSDRALVTASWSDNPVRIGTSSKKASSKKVEKKQAKPSKAPEAVRISDIVKLLAPNSYELTVDNGKGVLGSIIQTVVDVLAGEDFDITSLDLGNLPTTATKLYASVQSTPTGKIFDLTAPAVKGSGAGSLPRGVAGVRTGVSPRNTMAQMFLPIAEQQQKQLMKKGAGASVIPSTLFYRMVAATEPVVDKWISSIRVSRDCSAAAASLKRSPASRQQIAAAVAQAAAWMSNFDKQGHGRRSSALTFQSYQSQGLDLLPGTTMDQLVIVIFAKRANAEEWAGQACVLHADGSHIVGIFENCLCASGRSAPAPASLRLSAPIAANAKTHTPVPASARFSKTTFDFKASPASSATAHSDASSTVLSSGSTAPSSVGEDSEDEYEEVEVEEEVVEKKASSTGGGVDAFLKLVVDTIAEETGTAPADIRSSAFADIGIDSLMSLALLDRLREGTSVEIPGSLFIDCATMQDLEEFARENIKEDGPTAPAATTTKVVKKVKKVKANSAKPKKTASVVVSTPTPAAPVAPAPAGPSPVPEATTGALTVSAFLKLVVDIISEETGTSAADIMASAFADIGIDSLMSLALLDRLRDAAAMEIPGSLFIDCATMQDLEEFAKEHLPEAASAAASGKSTADVEAKAAAHPLAIPGADTSAGTSFDSLLGELDRPMKLDFPKITQATASAVLLGGRKTNDGDGPRPIFLIPDGSGSAAVFQNLPAIGRVAYGLNSPFLKTGKKWEGGVPEIAHHYIAQIKAKQATGPYIIGGWSYGGNVCYEIVLQLALQGERVEALLLLDSPCPRKMPPLPTTILSWAEENAALNGLGIKNFPPNMAAHFRWAIGTLASYNPPSLPLPARATGKGLKTCLLTAVDGVGADPAEVEDTNETVSWLFGDRRGLGPHGWEMLLGEGGVEVVEFAGNHFTMMERQFAGGWAKGIVDFLAKHGL